MNNVSFQKNMQKGLKIIKKYGNRKLYDTEQSSYVVLKDIEKMIRNKEEIQIIDNETKDDITIATLIQIIFSSEKKSTNSIPLDVLTAIIREGDGSLSAFLAKLGIFTDTGGSEKDPSSLTTEKFSEKKMNIAQYSNIEQKITNLMNSNDVLNNNKQKDHSIPELPGSKSLI